MPQYNYVKKDKSLGVVTANNPTEAISMAPDRKSDSGVSLISAPITPTTPVAPAATNNPISSSTNYRNNVGALNTEIESKYKDATLSKSQRDAERLLEAERSRMKADYEADIGGIKSAYEEAARLQGERQTKDYAGRSTGLVTSGGGFLGATQSQQGVLQNLSNDFEEEKGALMAKRDAALQSARSAFRDKSFKLATEQLKLAKDTEQELYNRQKDFADQKLTLAREARSQKEFDMGIADKKISAFALMDDEEFNSIPESEVNNIDSSYFPGYTKLARGLEQKSIEGKSIENDLKFQNSLQTLINKTPAGKTFTIGGTTYAGMKTAGTGSTKGSIPASLATQLGVPSLAGKKESDIILSLSFSTPPQWYKEYYKSSAPEVYSNITPQQLAQDWATFTSQPDIEAYKNSSVVTKRIEADNNSFSISQEDINNAMAEVE